MSVGEPDNLDSDELRKLYAGAEQVARTRKFFKQMAKEYEACIVWPPSRTYLLDDASLMNGETLIITSAHKVSTK